MKTLWWFDRRQGEVHHCHIRTKQEWGQTKFYLVEQSLFDSLYSLIVHYRSHPLRSPVRVNDFPFIQWMKIIKPINTKMLLFYRDLVSLWTDQFLSPAITNPKIGTTHEPFVPGPKSCSAGIPKTARF